MTPETIAALVAEFRRRARKSGPHLSAEAAWHTAADLLEDAAKQSGLTAPATTRKTLGLRYTR